MSIRIKLTDSIDVVQQRVNEAISELATENINKGKLKAQAKISQLVNRWIISQPEMKSLMSYDIGSLAGQFGLPAGQGFLAVEAIAQSVADSITVQFSRFNPSSLAGDLNINIQPEGFSNILNLGVGHVVFSGGDLHWLDWLLTKGDTIIVVGYHYEPKSGAGRSSLGYMSSGQAFRVPPEFSGTAENNFITRAIIGQPQEAAISNIIEMLISGTL